MDASVTCSHIGLGTYMHNFPLSNFTAINYEMKYRYLHEVEKGKKKNK